MSNSPTALDQKPFILLGGGGHGRVVLSLLKANNAEIIGVCDPALPKGTNWHGIKVFGDDSALSAYDPKDIYLANGLGMFPGKTFRRDIFDTYVAKGFTFPSLFHPSAIIDPDVTCAQEGVQIMAGAVVQTGSTLAQNVIINTRAGVDHDCTIGAHAHIAPGATLCGNVNIGESAFIGAGATIIQSKAISAADVVPAGALIS